MYSFFVNRVQKEENNAKKHFKVFITSSSLNWNTKYYYAPTHLYVGRIFTYSQFCFSYQIKWNVSCITCSECISSMLIKFSILTFLALRLSVDVSIAAVSSSSKNSVREEECILGVCWVCDSKNMRLGDDMAIKLRGKSLI